MADPSGITVVGTLGAPTPPPPSPNATASPGVSGGASPPPKNPPVKPTPRPLATVPRVASAGYYKPGEPAAPEQGNWFDEARSWLSSHNPITTLSRGGMPAGIRDLAGSSIIPGMPNLGGFIQALSLFDEATTHGLATNSALAGWNTFIHGESQGQYNEDTIADEAHAMGISVEQFERLPGWEKTAKIVAMQMLTDPLTYVGGSGIARTIADSVGTRTLPAVFRAYDAVANVAGKIGQREALEQFAHAGAQIHGWFTAGGQSMAAMLRDLARTNGPEGVKRYGRLFAIFLAHRGTSASLDNILGTAYERVFHGLPVEAKTALLHAANTLRPGSLGPALLQRYKSLLHIYDTIGYLGGTPALRRRYLSNGFVNDLARNFDIDQGLGARNIINSRTTAVGIRELPEDDKAEILKSLKKVPDIAKMVVRDYLSGDSPVTNDVISALPEQFVEAGRRMIRVLSHTIATSDMMKQVTREFPEIEGSFARLEKSTVQTASSVARDVAKTGDSKMEQLDAITRQRWNALPQSVKHAFTSGDAERRLADWLRSSGPVGAVAAKILDWSNAGKGSMLALPNIHMKNIITLLSTANPAAVARAAVTFARMRAGFVSPEVYDNIIHRAARLGTTGLPNVEQGDFEKMLRTYVPVIGRALGGIYHFSSKSLWAFDDAAKEALHYFETREMGGDALRAATEVQKKMVNYGLVAPYQDFMRFLFPFATWHGGLPAAIFRQVLHHPERILFANRATQGIIAGAPFGTPMGPMRFSTPLSEVNQLAGGSSGYSQPTNNIEQGAWNYARSGLSLTGRLVSDKLGIHPPAPPPSSGTEQGWQIANEVARHIQQSSASANQAGFSLLPASPDYGATDWATYGEAPSAGYIASNIGPASNPFGEPIAQQAAYRLSGMVPAYPPKTQPTPMLGPGAQQKLTQDVTRVMGQYYAPMWRAYQAGNMRMYHRLQHKLNSRIERMVLGAQTQQVQDATVPQGQSPGGITAVGTYH